MTEDCVTVALRMYPNILSWICRYAKDTMLGEDVIQTVYTKFFEKRHELQSRLTSEGAISAYLTTACRNTYLDYMRKGKLKRQNVRVTYAYEMYLDFMVIVGQMIDKTDIEGEMIYAEERELFHKVFAQIPTKDRELLLDLYFYDKTIKDIARERNAKEPTVKSWLFRARENFRLTWKIQQMRDQELAGLRSQPRSFKT